MACEGQNTTKGIQKEERKKEKKKKRTRAGMCKNANIFVDKNNK